MQVETMLLEVGSGANEIPAPVGMFGCNYPDPVKNGKQSFQADELTEQLDIESLGSELCLMWLMRGLSTTRKGANHARKCFDYDHLASVLVIHKYIQIYEV